MTAAPASLNPNVQPSPRRWRKPALLAVVALVLLGASGLAGMPGMRDLLSRSVETLDVVRSDLVQTVVASDRVVTPQRVSIGVEVTGRVAGVPVREGQSVKRGERLIVLDDQNERATLAQTAATVDQAGARLRQLREFALLVADRSNP